MVVIPMVVPAVSAAHSEAEQAPTQSCGKGYTYTKLDSTRWKCLTDEEAEKIAAEHEKSVNTGGTIALVVIVALMIIGALMIAAI